MIHSFEARLQAWLARIQKLSGCTSQQMAFNQVLHEWIETNLAMGVPEKSLQHLRSAEFSVEKGWKGIGSKVAYWDVEGCQIVRIYLHDDGTIVIQRLDAAQQEILLTVLGQKSRTVKKALQS